MEKNLFQQQESTLEQRTRDTLAGVMPEHAERGNREPRVVKRWLERAQRMIETVKQTNDMVEQANKNAASPERKRYAGTDTIDRELLARNALKAISAERAEFMNDMVTRMDAAEASQFASLVEQVREMKSMWGKNQQVGDQTTLLTDLVEIVQGLDARLQEEVLNAASLKAASLAADVNGSIKSAQKSGWSGVLEAASHFRLGFSELQDGFKGRHYEATINGHKHFITSQQQQALVLAQEQGLEVHMERAGWDNFKETLAGMSFRSKWLKQGKLKYLGAVVKSVNPLTQLALFKGALTAGREEMYIGGQRIDADWIKKSREKLIKSKVMKTVKKVDVEKISPYTREMIAAEAYARSICRDFVATEFPGGVGEKVTLTDEQSNKLSLLLVGNVSEQYKSLETLDLLNAIDRALKPFRGQQGLKRMTESSLSRRNIGKRAVKFYAENPLLQDFLIILMTMASAGSLAASMGKALEVPADQMAQLHTFALNLSMQGNNAGMDIFNTISKLQGKGIMLTTFLSRMQFNMGEQMQSIRRAEEQKQVAQQLGEKLSQVRTLEGEGKTEAARILAERFRSAGAAGDAVEELMSHKFGTVFLKSILEATAQTMIIKWESGLMRTGTDLVVRELHDHDFAMVPAALAAAEGLPVDQFVALQKPGENGQPGLTPDQIVEVAHFSKGAVRDNRSEMLKELPLVGQIRAVVGLNTEFNAALEEHRQFKIAKGAMLARIAASNDEYKDLSLAEVEARLEAGAEAARVADAAKEANAGQRPKLQPKHHSEVASVPNGDMADDLRVGNNVRLDLMIPEFILNALNGYSDSEIDCAVLAGKYIDWIRADSTLDADGDRVDRSILLEHFQRMGFDLNNPHHQETLKGFFTEVFKEQLDSVKTGESTKDGKISLDELKMADGRDGASVADPKLQGDANDGKVTLIVDISGQRLESILLKAQLEGQPELAAFSDKPEGYLEVDGRVERLEGMRAIVTEVVHAGNTELARYLVAHPEALTAAAFEFYDAQSAKGGAVDLDGAIKALEQHSHGVQTVLDVDIARLAHTIDHDWDVASRVLAEQADLALEGADLSVRSVADIKAAFADKAFIASLFDTDGSGVDTGLIARSDGGQQLVGDMESILLGVVAGSSDPGTALEHINQQRLIAAAVNYRANVGSGMPESEALKLAVDRMPGGSGLPDVSGMPDAWGEVVEAIIAQAHGAADAAELLIIGPPTITGALDGLDSVIQPNGEGNVVTNHTRADGTTVVVTDASGVVLDADASIRHGMVAVGRGGTLDDNMALLDPGLPVAFTDMPQLELNTDHFTQEQIHASRQAHSDTVGGFGSSLSAAVSATDTQNAQIAAVQAVATAAEGFGRGQAIGSDTVSLFQAERSEAMHDRSEGIVEESQKAALDALQTDQALLLGLEHDIVWYHAQEALWLDKFQKNDDPASSEAKLALDWAKFYDAQGDSAEADVQKLIAEGDKENTLGQLVEHAGANGQTVLSAIDAIKIRLEAAIADQSLDQAVVQAEGAAAVAAIPGWNGADGVADQIAQAQANLDAQKEGNDGNDKPDILESAQKLLDEAKVATDLTKVQALQGDMANLVKSFQGDIAIADQVIAKAEAMKDGSNDALIEAQIAGLVVRREEAVAILRQLTTDADADGADDGGLAGQMQEQVDRLEQTENTADTVAYFLMQGIETTMDKARLDAALELYLPGKSSIEAAVDFLNAVKGGDDITASQVLASGIGPKVIDEANKLYADLTWVDSVSWGLLGSFGTVQDARLSDGSDFGAFVLEHAATLHQLSDKFGSTLGASDLVPEVMSMSLEAGSIDPLTSQTLTEAQRAEYMAIRDMCWKLFTSDQGLFALQAGLTPDEINAAKFLLQSSRLPAEVREAAPTAAPAATETPVTPTATLPPTEAAQATSTPESAPLATETQATVTVAATPTEAAVEQPPVATLTDVVSVPVATDVPAERPNDILVPVVGGGALLLGGLGAGLWAIWKRLRRIDDSGSDEEIDDSGDEDL